MLANFRRKTGALSTVPGTPRLTSLQSADTLPTQPGLGNGTVGDFEGGLQSLLSLPQMGEGFDGIGESFGAGGEEAERFAWPTEFSPSNLPVWLQDGVGFAKHFDWKRANDLKFAELYGSRPSSRRFGFAFPPTRVSPFLMGTKSRWKS